MTLGVAIIDIGGGTTDLSVCAEGSNVFTSVIVMGGHRITQDVAHGLRTSVAEAEAIKRKHGCALISMIEGDDVIEVPGVGPRPPREFKRRFLAEIIEPRVEEILLMAQQELLASGCAELAASGLVLTGGASQMEGMIEIAEDIFQMPVRQGVPTSIPGGERQGVVSLAEGGFASMVSDPKFATGVGLVLYGATHEPMAEAAEPAPAQALRSRRRPGNLPPDHRLGPGYFLSRGTSWFPDCGRQSRPSFTPPRAGAGALAREPLRDSLPVHVGEPLGSPHCGRQSRPSLTPPRSGAGALAREPLRDSLHIYVYRGTSRFPSLRPAKPPFVLTPPRSGAGALAREPLRDSLHVHVGEPLGSPHCGRQSRPSFTPPRSGVSGQGGGPVLVEGALRARVFEAV